MVNPALNGTPTNVWLTPWNSVYFGDIGLGQPGGANDMGYLVRIISSDFAGDAKITQLCTIDATALPPISVSNALDNSDPYSAYGVAASTAVNRNPNPVGNINLITFNDGPSDGWISSFHMNASFTDYVMFTPGGAGDIYVPLGKLTWGTSFAASYPSTNISPNSVTGPTGPDASSDWPVWTDVFSNPE